MTTTHDLRFSLEGLDDEVLGVGSSEENASGTREGGTVTRTKVQLGRSEKKRSRRKKVGGKAKVKKGVVYLSRIPPYMRPAKVKHLLSAIGRIGRLYLAPESDEYREKRKRAGGNSRRNFTEGWVEFESKADAKRAALLLNCKPIEAGNKRSYYHDDLWAVRLGSISVENCQPSRFGSSRFDYPSLFLSSTCSLSLCHSLYPTPLSDQIP